MTKINNANQVIKNMIKTGRIPGAFIFEGSPELAGSHADMLAKAAVCSDYKYKLEHGGACGACQACAKAAKNIHPDIIIAEPEGEGSQSFHIDKVRELIADLYLAPNESERKVYIIKDMHNMTPQGQNALLKSLEEPPVFVIFIITAQNLDLILETVKSRAVKFSLGEASDSQDDYADIINNILGGTADKLALYQDIIKKLDKAGKPGVINFYYKLENAVRDILAAKICSSDIELLYFNNKRELLDNCAVSYSVKKILELYKKIGEHKSDLEYNANMRLNLSSFFSAII